MKAPLSSPQTVLVIDDEPSILSLIKKHLNHEGYTVISVLNGSDGIEAARQEDLKAALVDLNLGSMSGFEVLIQIKKIKPSLPVIIVTGEQEEIDGRKAVQLGALDYLTKPIDFRYLKNVLSLL